jgi:predicted HicB family RNase H-like nuclease
MLQAVKQVSARIEDDLALRVKVKALETGVTLNEVIERILRLYVEGKVTVPRKEPV